MEAADSMLSFSNWVDLTHNSVDPSSIAYGGFRFWMILAFSAALFLSAGAFSTLAKNKYDSRRFWGESGTWVFPYIRLTIWSIIPLGLFLLPAGIPMIVKKIKGDDIPQDVLLPIFLWVAALAMIGFFLWRIVFDYARAWSVSQDLRATRKAVYRATIFVFRKAPMVFSFAIVVALLHVGAVYLSVRLSGWANSTWSENPYLPALIAQVTLMLVFALRIVRYRGVLEIMNHYGVGPVSEVVELGDPKAHPNDPPSQEVSATESVPATDELEEAKEIPPEEPKESDRAEMEPQIHKDAPLQLDGEIVDGETDSTTEKIKSGEEDSDLASYLDSLVKK